MFWVVGRGGKSSPNPLNPPEPQASKNEKTKARSPRTLVGGSLGCNKQEFLSQELTPHVSVRPKLVNGRLSKSWSPFWIPMIIRHLIFRVPPKGIIILTTTQILNPKTLGFGRRGGGGGRGVLGGFGLYRDLGYMFRLKQNSRGSGVWGGGGFRV